MRAIVNANQQSSDSNAKRKRDLSFRYYNQRLDSLKKYANEALKKYKKSPYVKQLRNDYENIIAEYNKVLAEREQLLNQYSATDKLGMIMTRSMGYHSPQQADYINPNRAINRHLALPVL